MPGRLELAPWFWSWPAAARFKLILGAFQAVQPASGATRGRSRNRAAGQWLIIRSELLALDGRLAGLPQRASGVAPERTIGSSQTSAGAPSAGIADSPPLSVVARQAPAVLLAPAASRIIAVHRFVLVAPCRIAGRIQQQTCWKVRGATFHLGDAETAGRAAAALQRAAVNGETGVPLDLRPSGAAA